MRLRELRWLCFVLLFACSLAIISQAPVKAQPGVFRDEGLNNESADTWREWEVSDELKAKFDKKIEQMKFQDKPFWQVMSDLQAVIGFNLTMPERKLLEKPITIVIEDMKAGVALKLVLDIGGFKYKWDTKEGGRSVLSILGKLSEVDNNVLLVSHMPLDKATAILTKELGDDGTVQELTHMNAVLVRAPKERVADLTNLLKLIDKPPLQVMIESMLLEVSSNNYFNAGVKWGGPAASSLSGMSGGSGNFFTDHVDRDDDENGPSDIFTSLVDMSGPSSILSGGQAGIGFVFDHITFAAELDLLRVNGKGRILSAPRIAVINGEEAKILVGKEVVYNLQTTATSGGTTVASSEFREVGIKLTVTPIISHDGYVTLEVHPEVSDIIGTTDQDSPPIATVSAQTIVRVKDHQTTIIGGLISKKEEYVKGRVPGISRIPLIGNLFKNRSDTKEQNEYIFMITPHIIRTDEDWDLGALKRAGVSRAAMEEYKTYLQEQLDIEKGLKDRDDSDKKYRKYKKNWSN